MHAAHSLFFILGFSKEGLQLLKNNYNFLAQMVLSPMNSVLDVLLQQACEEEVLKKKAVDRNKKSKITTMARFDILRPMLDVLQKFGDEPDCKKKKTRSLCANSSIILCLANLLQVETTNPIMSPDSLLLSF